MSRMDVAESGHCTFWFKHIYIKNEKGLGKAKMLHEPYPLENILKLSHTKSCIFFCYRYTDPYFLSFTESGQQGRETDPQKLPHHPALPPPGAYLHLPHPQGHRGLQDGCHGYRRPGEADHSAAWIQCECLDHYIEGKIYVARYIVFMYI